MVYLRYFIYILGYSRVRVVLRCQADARDQCVAFSDVGRGERDVLLVCISGEVQLGTKERAEIPELHAGLPVQAQAPLDLVTCQMHYRLLTASWPGD